MDPCDHPVQVGGLCAVCGKSVDDDSSQERSSSQLHDISGVKVSSAEAARLDSESTRRLLSQRKLALIVDLDQTIIHATVDPTVGEWMKDARNPNYGALADVGKFFLGVDGKAVIDPALPQDDNKRDEAPVEPQGEGCWYYVKPRPGLQRFLEDLSKKFEMHVYTMGTRTYAESVCKLVDPNGTIFGARIISRDENGSLVQKSLKKLFPMDTSMVVIIDDRADVWQWSPNLVRVSPFDFFVGIGDINATFLPKLTATTSVAPSSTAASETDDETTADSLLERGIGASGEGSESSEVGSVQRAQKEREEDDAAKSAAAESQKTAVNEQIDARPLAKMQEALEGQTASQQGQQNDAQNTGDHESAPSSSSSTQEAAAVLREDDKELVRLQNILEDVHHRWYRAWQSKQSDEDEKPAITGIIASIKQLVLRNCNIVFSSVVPLHQDPASTEFWRMALEFGARCSNSVDARTTHVVAAKAGTEKVLMAQRQGVHAVWCSWLSDSCLHWVRLPEQHYALPSMLQTRQGEHLDRQQLDDSTADSALEADAEDEDASDYAGDNDTDQGFGDMNWDEANDELDEVLAGLSDEDDDDESTTDIEGAALQSAVPSEALPRSPTKRGRESGGEAQSSSEQAGPSSRGSAPSTVNHADGSDLTLSPLSKRRRMTELRAGQSRLKESVSQEGSGELQDNDTDKKSEAPAPASAPRSNAPSEAGQSAGGLDEEDFLHSLEAELELQLDHHDESSSSQPATASVSGGTSPSAVEAQ